METPHQLGVEEARGWQNGSDILVKELREDAALGLLI